jgi:hypothetical protein
MMKSVGQLRQRANKRNKNGVGHHPTSEQNWKNIMSGEVRHSIGKACDHNTHVYGVCVRHLPACCPKQTVSLKYNPLTFNDDTNSIETDLKAWQTPMKM